MQTAQSLFQKAYPDLSSSQWRWVLDGGKLVGKHQAQPSQGDVIFTGHSDGRVRVWSAGTSVPLLQATVPFDSGGAGAKLRAVSAIQVRSKTCHLASNYSPISSQCQLLFTSYLADIH